MRAQQRRQHLQRRGQNIGGGVQVVLRMAADQFAVPREGHVAFDDAVELGALFINMLRENRNMRPIVGIPAQKIGGM
jgi:hypothetical protein